MLRSTLLAVLLTFAASAGAEGFNYSYGYVGYGNIDFDAVNADGGGLAIGGSYAFTDKFHGVLNYDSADLDPGFLLPDVDATRLSIGFGYNEGLTDAIDWFARASYESIDFDISGLGSADDSGYGLAVGMRFHATDSLELGASLNYVDYDDLGDDTGVEIGGVYSFDDSWALGLSGEFSDDVSSYMVTGRFYFGK